MLSRRRCCCGSQCKLHLVGCDGTTALAGATVTVRNSDGDTLDSGTTDDSGDWSTTAGCGSDRTVTVEATGYTTHDFTGQTLSSTTLDLSMAPYLDTDDYAICCGNCPLPKTIHYTWSSHHVVTGDHGGSGTATYRPGNGDWPAALGAMMCQDGNPVLAVSWVDPDGGATLSCSYLPTSYSCDPLNVVWGMPPEDECPGYSADTGITAQSMTVTA